MEIRAKKRYNYYGTSMDETTFTEIVQATKPIVLSAIRKTLPARFHHAIDDIVQETYLRAYRGLKKNRFRGDSAISTWLYTIARNETLRMIKTLARHEKNSRLAVPPAEPESAHAQVERESGLALLGNVIGSLPIKYRAVYELAARGMSDGEIAEHLSLSRGTVKSRKFRGRGIIEKLMRKGGYHGND
jgi:RNA polymerase sigma factor (sigma-70 family)